MGGELMPTLYEISNDLHLIEDLLTQESGEIDIELERWFDQVHIDKREKIDRYCQLLRELESRSAQRKEEATRLMTLARIDANGAARLKNRLLEFFEEHSIRKLETPRFRVSIAANGGKLPLITLADDLERIPDEYVEIKRSLKTDEVREAIEAGEDVWFAILGERGVHLRIK
jgi:hypothetical protein